MQYQGLSNLERHCRFPSEGLPAKNEDERSYRLACMEVWGSNCSGATAIELPGLTGWVHSNPLGSSGRGGDLHYLSVCAQGSLSRVVLADVSGHGEQAVSPAADLESLMHRYINRWDQSDFMRDLNRAFWRKASGQHYASVVMLGYHRRTGELVFTNAGHPPPLWYRRLENTWLALEERTPRAATKVLSVPVGMILGAEYTQTIVRLAVGDLLVLYTDGLTEAVNGLGEDLGLPALFEAARRAPIDSPVALGKAVVGAVDSFRMGAEPIDDQTLVVLRRSEYGQPLEVPLAA